MAKHGFRQKHHNDQQYLNGTPTRMEVANYVNALIEEKVIPELKKLIMTVNAHASLSNQVVLGLLIKKGICTEEEVKQMTEDLVKEATKAQDEKKTENETKEAEAQTSEHTVEHNGKVNSSKEDK